MNEVWKPIVGYEGYYEVSSHGRVRSIERTVTHKNGTVVRLKSVVLRPCIGTNGYYMVILSKNRKPKGAAIHVLVARHFLNTYQNGYVVNHKNGIKTDNNVQNLEYVTRSENARHAITHGLVKVGFDSVVAKTSREQGVQIRQLYAAGNITQEKLAQMYKVSRTTIHRILNYVYQ